jgi:hypothetical protein
VVGKQKTPRTDAKGLRAGSSMIERYSARLPIMITAKAMCCIMPQPGAIS